MAAGGGAVLAVERLVKRFDGRTVVDDLTFTVDRGEILALLGPNGAGKTTTVETLEGYHRPDGGRVRVLGVDPRLGGRALRARVGMMLQNGGMYPALRPPEVLRLFAQFYAAPLDSEGLIELVGLTDARRTAYRRLSGGEKQRLSLAAALIGRPEVLFLDEPTAGMDPEARQATWEIIRGQQARGVTVLLTTHDLDEADRLAGRVAIIDQGRLVALDTPAGLRTNAAGAAGYDIFIRARTPLDPARLDSLPSRPAVVAAEAGAVRIRAADPAAALIEITTWARAAGVELVQLRVGDSTLEDAYLRLTGGRQVDAAAAGTTSRPAKRERS